MGIVLGAIVLLRFVVNSIMKNQIILFGLVVKSCQRIDFLSTM